MLPHPWRAPITALLLVVHCAQALAGEGGPYRGRDPLDHVGDWVQRAPEDTDGTAPPEPQPASVEVKPITDVAVRRILADDAAALGEAVTAIIQRLWMPWDTDTVNVVVAPGLVPEMHYGSVSLRSPDANGNHCIEAITVSLGALAFTANTDELAFLIARQLARRSPGEVSSKRNRELMEAFLGQKENNALPTDYKGQLAADLLAMDRLISGGFNPLAAHSHLTGAAQWWRNATRYAGNDSILTYNKPVMEQRVQLVKLYFMRKIEEQDLAAQTSRTEPLPQRLSQLRQRVRRSLFFVNSPVSRMLGMEKRFTRNEFDKFQNFLNGRPSAEEAKAEEQRARARAKKETERANAARGTTPAPAEPTGSVWSGIGNFLRHRLPALTRGAATGIATVTLGAILMPGVLAVWTYTGIKDRLIPSTWHAMIASGGFVARHGTGWSLFNLIFPESQRRLLTGSFAVSSEENKGIYSKDLLTELRAGNALTPREALAAAESLSFELKSLSNSYQESRVYRNMPTFNRHTAMWEERIYLLGEALSMAHPFIEELMAEMNHGLATNIRQITEAFLRDVEALDLTYNREFEAAHDPSSVDAARNAHKERHDYLLNVRYAYLNKILEYNVGYHGNLYRRSAEESGQLTGYARRAAADFDIYWVRARTSRIRLLLDRIPHAVFLDPRLHETWIKLIESIPEDFRINVPLPFRDINTENALSSLKDSLAAQNADSAAEAISHLNISAPAAWDPLLLHNYHRWKDRLAAQAIAPDVTAEYRQSYLTLLQYIRGVDRLPVESQKLEGFARAYPSWQLFRNYWSSALSGEAATLAQVSLNSDYGQNWLFNLLMRGERTMLRQNLRARFSSVSSLTAIAMENWQSRGVNLGSFATDFSVVLLEHPDWIQSAADVDALLDSSYLWPRLGSLVQSRFEQALLGSVHRLFGERPHWQYDPQVSGPIHDIILQRLRAMGAMPTDGEAQLALWRRMTERGITWVTDSFLESILRHASDDLREQIYALAIEEQRIWDPTLKSTLLWDKITRQSTYAALVQSREAELTEAQQAERLTTLNVLLQENFVVGSSAEELALLEKLSRSIATSWQESLRIGEFLRERFGSAETDQRFALFERLTQEALQWPPADQENLVYFLRGDEEPSSRLRRLFSFLGPERIKRMYANLPTATRVKVIDQFIDAPDRGLLHRTGSLESDYSRRFLNRLTQTENRDAAQIARELLAAFFQALDESGHGLLKSYVISYLLAVDPSELKSPAHVLKQACIAIGTTGIKLGQQIAASRILGDEGTEIMSDLQENARDTLRMEKYRQVLNELNRSEMPFRLLDNLGSASMKSADLALDYTTGNTLVLKLMYEESINRTTLEFSFLEAMARILKKSNPSRYFMFGSVVRAAKESVKREQSMADEVEKSRIAKQLYARYNDFRVPNEALISPRLSAAEYAPGTSIRQLTPAQQAHVAARILETGNDILFGSEGDQAFDPDRHAGNFRHQVMATGAIINHAIDWGQLITVSAAQRTQIVRLFAAAAALSRAGTEDFLVNEIIETLGLTASTAQRQALSRILKQVFPVSDTLDITNYYTLLAALEEWGQPQPIVFFDFVRAIMQYDYYEKFLPADTRAATRTPTRIMTELVNIEVSRIEPQLSGLRVRLGHMWERCKELLE